MASGEDETNLNFGSNIEPHRKSESVLAEVRADEP
jgi:hypothetical protein